MSQVDEWGSTTNNDFELDGQGVSGEDLGGAGSIKQEGWYHFEVTDVVAELETVGKKGAEKSPAVRMDLTVLESVNGQAPAGAKHWQRLYVGAKGGGPAAEGSRNNVLRFGLGIGILKEVDGGAGEKAIVDAVTGSSKINMETLRRAKGKQCVGKIELTKDDKYGDKYEIQFARVYAVDDPSVAGVSKNLAALQMIGMGHVGAGGGGVAEKPKAGAKEQGKGDAKGKQPAAVAAAAGKSLPTPPVDTSPSISDDDLADL